MSRKPYQNTSKIKILSYPLYDEIRRDGITGCYYVRRGKKWGLMDQNGKRILSPGYAFLQLLDENHLIFQVKENQKWGVMDYKENQMIPPIYNEIRSFNDRLIFALKEEKWGIIDKKGNIVADFIFDDPFVLGKDSALVKINGGSVK